MRLPFGMRFPSCLFPKFPATGPQRMEIHGSIEVVEEGYCVSPHMITGAIEFLLTFKS